jgi:hypothetical protein
VNDDLLCPRPGRASTHHTSNAPADPARLPTRQHAPLTHKPWTERIENTGPATLHEPMPGLTSNPAPVDSLREELSTAFSTHPALVGLVDNSANAMFSAFHRSFRRTDGMHVKDS